MAPGKIPSKANSTNKKMQKNNLRGNKANNLLTSLSSSVVINAFDGVLKDSMHRRIRRLKADVVDNFKLEDSVFSNGASGGRDIGNDAGFGGGGGDTQDGRESCREITLRDKRSTVTAATESQGNDGKALTSISTNVTFGKMFNSPINTTIDSAASMTVDEGNALVADHQSSSIEDSFEQNQKLSKPVNTFLQNIKACKERRKKVKRKLK